MDLRIQTLLKTLYPGQVDLVSADLDALLDRWRGRLGERANRPDSCLFSQADALLITYADQVSRPGVSPLAALADFARTHLQGVVSAIHLLPFYPWSSDDGFAVKDYYQVDPAYGSWDEVRQLAQQFDLMFDAVFNHLSAQSEWFQAYLTDAPAFRDFFVSVTGDPDLRRVVRPRALPLLTQFPSTSGPRKVWTTFSADQVDLNVANPRVLLALVDALLFYVEQGAAYIRLDAIGFLWKEIGTSCIHLPQTHAVIRLFRAVLEQLGLPVRLVTETNVPHGDNIAYFGTGTDEAHMVYNFALPPLVLHAMATGNARVLTEWAEGLSTPSPQTAFLNFLASHDGIGLNPARGILSDSDIDGLVRRTLAHGGQISYKAMPDGSKVPYEMNINYLDALSDPGGGETAEQVARKFLTAQAIMLSLRGIPGIYFHSLFGSRGDPEAAQRTGIARRINRAKLTSVALEAALADSSSLASRVFRGFQQLLNLRRGQAAFSPTVSQRILGLDPRVFAVLRGGEMNAAPFLCCHNVSHSRVSVEWREGLSARIDLEPYESRWLPLGSRR